MRRLCLLGLGLVTALALAAPAAALPKLNKPQKRAISTLVNRVVTDLVLRHDLADGWKISGPDMRGGLTHKEWLAGRELPVQQLDIVNDPRKAWYATWKTRTEIGLVISLKTGHGKNAEMYEEESVLMRRHGRWFVDSFYVDGIFRLGRGHSGSCVTKKCKVTGLYDYAPGGGSSGLPPAKARIGGRWGTAVIVGLFGLPVAVLLAIGLFAYTRKRRARAEYLASRVSPSPEKASLSRGR